ncbi:OmpH family outer membrane protein [Aureibaculum sp. 2210JD6-5]|uniref:OmpH family outer membrane protein n=1 Tax=Aureibaculum sp. 2210JD6-5 TaxID=3103957 RepID=UPI002AAE815A|nr:OmpH family outer membrane protein [Aureibaculum sp. 2210JD6-5]MDY7396253.1 OmpH family outer membrane protein [Aureibaculum sp. 2210JD6-5]
MKLFKNLLLASVLLFGAMTVNAQSKVAHINTDELVAAMPETIQMQEELKKVVQAYQADFKEQTTALQTKMKKYDQEAPTQTDAENQKRLQEVQELQQKLRMYQQTAQEEMQKKEYDLYKPIAEKAQKAIEEVAAAKGIEYVFDSTPGKGLVIDNGLDLMADVKAKLGIK